MPQIVFTTDLQSGASSSQIEGIAGPDCEIEARRLRGLLGTPQREERTAEYAAAPVAQRRSQGAQVRQGTGRPGGGQ